VLLVDNGGFFPETANQHDVAWFLMDAMKLLGTDAVGVADRDLKYGIAFLRTQQKRTGLPLVSANLLDKKTNKPIFEPWVVKKVGTAKVGIFGLMSEKVDLGPARDSLAVQDPMVAAKKAIADLKKQGANVIVLLSNLGKVESEDLITAVPGMDGVIIGRNVPLLQKGRLIKNTVAVYGGEQGQNLGRTVFTLEKNAVTARENDMFVLGPEVGEKPEILQLVKSFEDSFNEKLRKQEMEAATQKQIQQEESPDRFLGSEVCIRCHTSEGEQWKTTSHSVAWPTLVNAKKDATPECITCHVVGFRKPTGFTSAVSTPHLAGVQCENCHGIGTQHDAFAGANHRVTEEVCTSCHQGDNDPTWNWEKKLPMIAHSNFSGETIKNKKNRMPGDAMMKGH
jgi:hypothetical protein